MRSTEVAPAAWRDAQHLQFRSAALQDVTGEVELGQAAVGLDDGLAGGAAHGQLLPDPFEDQHVGVHGHADGQSEAGQSRQRQCGAERGERAAGSSAIPAKSS